MVAPSTARRADHRRAGRTARTTLAGAPRRGRRDAATTPASTRRPRPGGPGRSPVTRPRAPSRSARLAGARRSAAPTDGPTTLSATRSGGDRAVDSDRRRMADAIGTDATDGLSSRSRARSTRSPRSRAPDEAARGRPPPARTRRSPPAATASWRSPTGARGRPPDDLATARARSVAGGPRGHGRPATPGGGRGGRGGARRGHPAGDDHRRPCAHRGGDRDPAGHPGRRPQPADRHRSSRRSTTRRSRRGWRMSRSTPAPTRSRSCASWRPGRRAARSWR